MRLRPKGPLSLTLASVTTSHIDALDGSSGVTLSEWAHLWTAQKAGPCNIIPTAHALGEPPSCTGLGT